MCDTVFVIRVWIKSVKQRLVALTMLKNELSEVAVNIDFLRGMKWDKSIGSVCISIENCQSKIKCATAHIFMQYLFKYHSEYYN